MQKLGHARAFQAIADREGGDRATGTKGYEDSVDGVLPIGVPPGR